MITDARKVLHPAAANHHDAVLLKVVPFARNVRGNLNAIRKPDAGHFPEG
jgi:hypothetical protein